MYEIFRRIRDSEILESDGRCFFVISRVILDNRKDAVFVLTL